MSYSVDRQLGVIPVAALTAGASIVSNLFKGRTSDQMHLDDNKSAYTTASGGKTAKNGDQPVDATLFLRGRGGAGDAKLLHSFHANSKSAYPAGAVIRAWPDAGGQADAYSKYANLLTANPAVVSSAAATPAPPATTGAPPGSPDALPAITTASAGVPILLGLGLLGAYLVMGRK